MKIYHNPRCSKSRQTLQIIEEAGLKPEIVKYLETPLSKAELKTILQQLNLSAQDIIRKGEAEYKTKFKNKDLSEEEWIEAMVEHPKLIERPIVVSNNKAVLGRPPENVKELL